MKEQQIIKIGIIGLGQIAQTIHIPLWSKMSNAEIAAVYDPDKDRAKAIAEKLKAKVYNSVDALLADEEIDAVHICSPTHTHMKYTLESLEANKHVLVEKPIARNFEESQKIFDVWKKTDRVVMVGMNQRFRQDAMILKTFLDNKDLGDIYYIRAGWNKPIRDAHSWRLKKSQSGGGVLLDLGILMIDLSLWLTNFPKIKSVSAMTFHHNIDSVEDTCIFQAFFDGGVIHIENSWSPILDSDEQWMRVYGTEGSAKMNPFNIHKMMHGNLVDITPRGVENDKNMYKKSYENELKHFIGAVRKLHPATCTPKDSIDRMKLIDAIYLSAKTGKEVKID